MPFAGKAPLQANIKHKQSKGANQEVREDDDELQRDTCLRLAARIKLRLVFRTLSEYVQLLFTYEL